MPTPNGPSPSQTETCSAPGAFLLEISSCSDLSYRAWQGCKDLEANGFRKPAEHQAWAGMHLSLSLLGDALMESPGTSCLWIQPEHLMGLPGPWSLSSGEERTAYHCDTVPQTRCPRVASPVQRNGVSQGCRFQEPPGSLFRTWTQKRRNQGSPPTVCPHAHQQCPATLGVGEAVNVRIMYP